MADNCLDVIFRSIREEFDRRYNITDPDAIDPDIIAFQKAIHALQCPVTALVVHLPNNISFWGGIECDSVSYIRLDLETPGHATWDFLGEFTTEQILANPSIAKSLLSQEPSSDYLQVLANGQTIGASDRAPDWLMIGIGGDVRTRQTIDTWFLMETLMMDFQPRIVSRAGTKLEFDKVYALQQPPTRSAAQLLSTDIHGDAIVPTVVEDDFQALTEQAKLAGEAQLIPKVPKGVSDTFEIARQLYTYACFHHWLSTAAHHYLFLAIEAAVKYRWCATLPNPVTVTNKAGVTTTLQKPHHQDFFHLREKYNNDKAWDYHNILVNGQRFEPSAEKLVDELGKLKLLTKWQQRRLKAGIRLRNHFSHREMGIIFPAGADRFLDIARDLNYLFHGP